MSSSEEKTLLACKADGVIGIVEVDKRYDALQVAIEEGVREAPSDNKIYSFLAPNGETVRFTREQQVACHELNSPKPSDEMALDAIAMLLGAACITGAVTLSGTD